MGSTSLFAVFNVLVGAYMVYAAVTGKGQVYNVENMPEHTHEKYRRMIRIFCFVAGPLCLTGGVLEYMSANNRLFGILAMILNGLVLAGVVGVIIITVRLRKPENKR